MTAITIRPVAGKADRKAFVDLQFRLYADDPAWVPNLKDELLGLITPGKNPFFEHAEVELFLAERGGRVVGRISAHVDRLFQQMSPEQGGGPDMGNWGLLEAEDAEVGAALIAHAEARLKARGLSRVLAPISMSMWEEPGLLIQGHDHPPTVMMGHNKPGYEAIVEGAGYTPAKDLQTFELDITNQFPPIVQRIIASGERNPRIRIRKVDKSRFAEEAATILNILNDAWSDNWGFVPFTDAEIAFAGKKLKPIIFEDLVMVAEVDGEPAAFMMTWPDLNEQLAGFGGSLLPFNWVKMLLWMRRPKVRTMRVPLMGVVKRLQATRLASQLAFMMIEYIRRASVADYGATRGEIGWILEDNQGMRSIAETVNGRVNKTYRIYEKRI
ncbi:N-acetyltransferase [Sphingomonas jatrophae]|uniref:N-acetyltransferase domain-containing protein n=1 Tax=Sphingomonas jatrophae TaxID=1166337 RepID=A0A1I6LBN5_9SPHN|nr:hypothetical protein SAMN05192580_2547 [Sphingomonas jatrophae]